MNDQWLKNFIISAEFGSFSKAAKSLYISAPSLVQQMNLFEKELGFTVFERSNTGLKLTPAGNAFLSTARELLSTYEAGVKNASALSVLQMPVLRFGFAPYQFPEKWLSLLNEFQEAYPDVRIRMVMMPMQEQISAIELNKIDVCLVAEPSRARLGDLRYARLKEDHYAFCMSSKHPLAKKRYLSKSEIEDYPIAYGEYPYMKQQFSDALKAAGCNKLRRLDTEYNLSSRFELESNEMFVIHNSWQDTFAMIHRVVESDISAGGVGYIYHKKHEEAVRMICDYFKEHDA